MRRGPNSKTVSDVVIRSRKSTEPAGETVKTVRPSLSSVTRASWAFPPASAALTTISLDPPIGSDTTCKSGTSRPEHLPSPIIAFPSSKSAWFLSDRRTDESRADRSQGPKSVFAKWLNSAIETTPSTSSSSTPLVNRILPFRLESTPSRVQSAARLAVISERIGDSVQSAFNPCGNMATPFQTDPETCASRIPGTKALRISAGAVASSIAARAMPATPAKSPCSIQQRGDDDDA